MVRFARFVLNTLESLFESEFQILKRFILLPRMKAFKSDSWAAECFAAEICILFF